MPVTVAAVAPEDRSPLCERILGGLPEWFGLEDSVREYVSAVAGLPTFAVGDDAFVAVKQHTPAAAELYVMGVRRERHRSGLGTALVAAAEDYLRRRGVEYLQVKTLGPSHPDEHYARTRKFYESVGFRALEEIASIWDETNPCLIMVKRI